MVGLGGCRLAQVFPNFVIKTQDPPLADGFGGLDQSDPNFWEDIVKSSSTINQLKFFNYRYHTFIFNPVSEDFEPTTHWRDLAWCSARKVLEGVNSHSDIALRQRIFGLNSINVDEKPILNLMVDEVLHPFFVFQIGSM